MDRECAVERDRAYGAVPDEIVDPRAPLHRLEGEVAQRMHGQMQREIGEHDQARGEPETPIRHLVAQDGDCVAACHERPYKPAPFPSCIPNMAFAYLSRSSRPWRSLQLFTLDRNRRPRTLGKFPSPLRPCIICQVSIRQRQKSRAPAINADCVDYSSRSMAYPLEACKICALSSLRDCS